MLEFLRRLFSSDGFMPHGHCYLWSPEIVWLHVISDALVALSYTTIPFTLYYFVRKRRDLPFNWMFLCFAVFIIACGATHYMEIWTLWTPMYRFSGIIKAITAAASVPTAILLVRLVPKALTIPTPEQLSKAHEDLKKAHEVLETRVRERTVELLRTNEDKEGLLEQLRLLNGQLEERVRDRTAELSAMLKEREILLQEVHHRVKNNLQVISSLINIQMRKLDERGSRAALEECQTRVQAIALIHEKLYQFQDYARVPFSEYAKSLAGNVLHATGIAPANISLDLAIEDLTIAVDRAIPCGLVLNELMTNALKHAFPDGRHGTIRVGLSRLDDGLLQLSVGDDGIGLPAGVDLRKAGSLGLQLVATLAEQLEGKVSIHHELGTTFELTFPSD